MELLLDRRGTEVRIAEGLLRAGATDGFCGQEVMELLLKFPQPSSRLEYLISHLLPPNLLDSPF